MSEQIDGKKPLEKVTTGILIVSIIIMLTGIIYVSVRPEEEFTHFFLLNEDQKMKDYPTNATIGEDLSFHVYIECHYQDGKEYQVRIYQGTNETAINSSISVSSQTAQTYLNETKKIEVNLANEENWTSPMQTISFNAPGKNQVIICELWEINDKGEWTYIPTYILILRIDIY